MAEEMNGKGQEPTDISNKSLGKAKKRVTSVNARKTSRSNLKSVTQPLAEINEKMTKDQLVLKVKELQKELDSTYKQLASHEDLQKEMADQLLELHQMLESYEKITDLQMEEQRSKHKIIKAHENAQALATEELKTRDEIIQAHEKAEAYSMFELREKNDLIRSLIKEKKKLLRKDGKKLKGFQKGKKKKHNKKKKNK